MKKTIVFDDCPNCEENDYSLVTRDVVKCNNCTIQFDMWYIPPGASIYNWAKYEAYKKDFFKIMASHG
jgi:hypothetical protein